MDKVAREDEKKEWYFSSVIATYWLEALMGVQRFL
jgi:hypothetical protein